MELIFARCIEAGLKPYMTDDSSKFIIEAVKPLLVLEKVRLGWMLISWLIFGHINFF